MEGYCKMLLCSNQLSFFILQCQWPRHFSEVLENTLLKMPMPLSHYNNFAVFLRITDQKSKPDDRFIIFMT